jgi:hypothetical protein
LFDEAQALTIIPCQMYNDGKYSLTAVGSSSAPWVVTGPSDFVSRSSVDQNVPSTVLPRAELPVHSCPRAQTSQSSPCPCPYAQDCSGAWPYYLSCRDSRTILALHGSTESSWLCPRKYLNQIPLCLPTFRVKKTRFPSVVP